MNDIGTLIRLYRKDKNMSQKDLMNSSGVSANSICDIEKGKVSPTIRTLNALAEGLGMMYVGTFIGK